MALLATLDVISAATATGQMFACSPAWEAQGCNSSREADACISAPKGALMFLSSTKPAKDSCRKVCAPNHATIGAQRYKVCQLNRVLMQSTCENCPAGANLRRFTPTKVRHVLPVLYHQSQNLHSVTAALLEGIKQKLHTMRDLPDGNILMAGANAECVRA